MQDKNFCTLASFNSFEELLTKELSFSKSLIKKYISKKKLQSSLREREEVFIPLEVLNLGFVNPVYEGEELEILKEDENFIAINKPKGIHGHPLSYGENNTIVNFLRSRNSWSVFLDKSEQAESGLLYRLDHETSGVLIFAKSKEIYQKVRGTFLESAKKKSYLAIVSGEFQLEGKHSHYLESYGEKGARMRSCDSGEREVAIEVSLLKYDKKSDLSLLEIELGQGVRHQIRCQLSTIGFPILGDTLYEGTPSERVYLHAYKYEIRIEDISFEVTSLKDELFLKLFDLNSCF